MQIDSVFQVSTLGAESFITLSIVNVTIGLCLIIFGLVRQKKLKRSTFATGCIVLGTLTIISHTIQLVIRMLT